MKKRALETYLMDHLAGSLFAIQLIERCRDSYPDLESYFGRLHEEVERDRDVLKSLLLRIGGSESRLKEGAAWLMEKMGHLKHREPSHSVGSTLLERLETLSLGIAGKQSLWQALDAASGGDGRFGGLVLSDLARRAQEQYDEIENLRLAAARKAFAVQANAPAVAGSRDGKDEAEPLRGVLLDVDGTLIETNDAHAHAWVEVLEESGRSIPFERVRPLIGMGGDKMIPELTGLDPDGEEGTALSERRTEIFLDRHLEQCRPFPEVRALLERMREAGLGLTVTTSANEEEMERILDVAGVADLVDRSTSAGEVEESKPDPDVLEAALAKSGWRARDVLLLGDTPFDVAAGAEAEVGVVALLCGGSGEAELVGAVAVYKDPSDLLARFESSPFALASAGRDAPGAGPTGTPGRRSFRSGSRSPRHS